jgi:hypothetical protein
MEGSNMEWATQKKNDWQQPAENGSGSANVMEPAENVGVAIPDKAGMAHVDSPETAKKNFDW